MPSSPAGQDNVPQDWTQWKRQLLAKLDAPDTPANEAFLNAWARREGGGGQNNPFNTTYPLAGATLLAGNTAGVKNYPLPKVGLEATYLTFTGGSGPSWYGDLLGDMRAGRLDVNKCYPGLKKWSGGYCSLSGVDTAAPDGGSGTGVVGDPMANQGYGPAYGTRATGPQYGSCLHSTRFSINLGLGHPGGTICWDPVVGGLLVVAGGLLIVGGVAVILVATVEGTPAGRAATKALAVPAAGYAIAHHAAGAPQRRRNAAAAADDTQTRRRAAQEAAESRRDAAEARRRTDARRRARHANAAERRRAEAHDVALATRVRTAAARPGRTYPGIAEPPPRLRRTTRREPLPDKAPF